MNPYHILVGYRSRYNYWGCSAVARFIAKHTGQIQKPRSAEMGEFRRIREENRKINRFAAWMVEDGLDIVQDIVYFPHDVYINIKTHLKNRFIRRHYMIDTGLEKWQWHESDTRIVAGLFNIVVQFVEEEKAHMNDLSFHSDDDKRPKIKDRREAGLAYMKWESELGEESPHQAEVAKDLLEIYLWIKDIRPNRPDPYETVGLKEFYEDQSIEDIFLNNDLPAHIKEKRTKMWEEERAIEEKYNNQDTEMLIRIIKIRQGMWT